MTKIKMAMGELTTMGEKFTLVLIAIIMPIIFVIGAFVLIKQVFIPSVQLTNRPVQLEQVEVIGKRIKLEPSTGPESYDIRHYIVAFKFSDGSVKEFRAGINKNRKFYDSIHEGDKGILTYKEIENIEGYKNEDMRWDGRRLISFEKNHSSELDD